MDRKDQMKGLLALVACVALFVGALGLYLLFGEDKPQNEEQPVSGGVVITEIMSDNGIYPDGSGRLLDYVELCNLTGETVDISKFKLSDDESTIGFTFPQGTVLQPNGYIVVWCDNQGGDAYAKFGVSKDGGETVYLYNSANVIIDRVTVPALEENQPYVRNAEGNWCTDVPASPGFGDNAQWLASLDYETPAVEISEVQASNVRTWLDADRRICDWIEGYNPGMEPAVLDGAYLSDDPADPLKWQIPSLTVAPGAYAVIFCGGDGIAEPGFGLASGGGSIVLTGRYGDLICSLEYPALERDMSWTMQNDGAYAVAAQPTPGFENTEDGYLRWLRSVGVPEYTVVISEIQTANCSAILDSRGNLCDWIELYNSGSEPVALDGCFLSDDSENPFKWQITAMTLEPGAYAVIPCAGSGAGAGEADFGLSRSGCTVTLYGPVGNRIAGTECPAMAEDRSWQRMEDGTYIESALFSPGFENTEAGYEAFRDSQTVLGALAVSEVMPSNDRYLIQWDGEYYDWLELKNISDFAIDLSEYALSDSGSDLLLCPLPQRMLEPGETVVIICSGDSALSGNYIHAPFTLNREECFVYVTHLEQGLSDYVRISGVPLMGSAGRMNGETGIFYFSTPTPGEENSGGVAEITADPFVETPDGVYNDVSSVSVVLSGEGQIYYTLDGSEPTMNDLLYTGPVELSATTVVRARSYADGKLPSAVVTASYIINENHTLPVISIAMEPGDMYGYSGIYTNPYQDWEVPCNLTLYEGDGGFTIDCGLKLYGHTGLTMAKKSFKVNFRSCYGEKVLNYPVYGEDGPWLYDSLCIRAGQDYPQAIFRDELFTSLCREMTDTVLAQRDKFCILYINGEYYGIYCMKEAFNELFYAQNRDVREESVEIVQAPVYFDTEIHEFMRFLINNDMTREENWEYACTVFDMDSVIDWMIIEGYSTNGDIQQNLRYFRSSDNGYRYEMAFYDLDWSFYYHNAFSVVLSYEQGDWQHVMLTRNLMKNPTFRKTFLERLSYHMTNTLSNENVLARIDYYHDLLAPEVPRERSKWGDTYESWEFQVDKLRKFITDSDHLGQMVDRLVRYIGLTQEEIDTYFWRWR